MKASLVIILIQEEDTGPVSELRAIMPVTSFSAFFISISHSILKAACLISRKMLLDWAVRIQTLPSSLVEMGCTVQLNLQVCSLAEVMHMILG